MARQLTRRETAQAFATFRAAHGLDTPPCRSTARGLSAAARRRRRLVMLKTRGTASR